MSTDSRRRKPEQLKVEKLRKSHHEPSNKLMGGGGGGKSTGATTTTSLLHQQHQHQQNAICTNTGLSHGLGSSSALSPGNENKCCHCNTVDALRDELENETEKRRQLDAEYARLKIEFEEFTSAAEEAKKNPRSKYDSLIAKQMYFNEQLSKQVNESKEKLKNMSQSLEHMQACGKDCNMNVRDLLIDYNCISKNDLAKEIKRFQRMQIDLKAKLDRLNWRLDCESKLTDSLSDQYHKLQMDLYFLKNLNSKNTKDVWLS